MDDAECIGELPNHIKLWFYPDQKITLGGQKYELKHV